ncbi:MAG: GIY-YIG nuclease family protein [Patescibacteria group bacterium]|nr:GIY-YIG nuclease family protein [Patescibacteria group bacterium]
MFKIYWLVSEDKRRTYIGFSDNVKRRMQEHATGQVKTTRNFGKAICYMLETVGDAEIVRKKEKYWKSSAGRKELKERFSKIVK